MFTSLIDRAERGQLPDAMIRLGIRHLLRQRLRAMPRDVEQRWAQRQSLLEAMRNAPLALSTDVANAQHYEVPAAYFQACLGRHLKYSACLWEPDVTDLDTAEARMLALSCTRADLQDGQRVLELGCGWGSLSLWMAAQYPNSRIVAVSNSYSQRAFIEQQAQARQLSNLEIITADINTFTPANPGFDRIVSVEMFEHLRNWPLLLQRVSQWAAPQAKLFLHVFCHRDTPYFFASEGASNWMGQYFFRDGLMPSADLPRLVTEDWRVLQHWAVNGQHYARTCNTWLQRQDQARATLWPVFTATYGAADAERWWQRWRIFYMACAELFAYQRGNEWFVTHITYERR